MVWNSNTAWRQPWATSGWYGVYEVTNSERPARARTTGGTSWSYAPAAGEAHQAIGTGPVGLAQ